jgi:L-ascorbate metabolism protein UlaG (beta-lactamase superfamily)
MKITWYGHAAFLIETNGTRIIHDPYKSPDCGSYAPIEDEADILVLSHDNETYHSCRSQVSGSPVEVHGEAIYWYPETVNGITFTSYEVYENDQGEGPNYMMTYEVEGLRISHLGDLGHPLNPFQMAGIRGTDILLALAGGPPTIKVDDLKDLVEELQPKITIPMHFKNEKIKLDIRPVEDYLDLHSEDQYERIGAATIEVAKENIGDYRPIVVLDPAR